MVSSSLRVFYLENGMHRSSATVKKENGKKVWNVYITFSLLLLPHFTMIFHIYIYQEEWKDYVYVFIYWERYQKPIV